jgi:glutathione peroxidase
MFHKGGAARAIAAVAFGAMSLAHLSLSGSLAAKASGAPLDWTAVELRGLEGETVDGSAFAGRVVLLVNTASRCAFTPQYEGLEALSDRFSGVGLTVVGIPSNDFGRQEPGTNADIAAFCTATYGVSFPMLEKSHVVGPEAHPLFAWAREAGGRAAVPGWNFHKVLIGRDGRFVAGFPSFVPPSDPALVAAVERALATPAF